MLSGLSIAQATVEAAQVLRRAGVPEARLEAASLLAHTIARDRTFLITHAADLLSPSEVRRFLAAIKRRAAGEPLQYITGQQEFYNLNFEVTPDVLIPRLETELLVETALKLLGGGARSSSGDETQLICDVGTGSGCIVISILHERPLARGVGLDISPGALSIAARNAARHDVRNRLALIASDCFTALDEANAPFEMIVSNPPYIPAADIEGLQREVREHEPSIALTPGADGLRVLRRLLMDAPRFLIPGGHLLMEIGYDQHAAIQSLVPPETWTLLDIHKDLQGIPRIVALRRN